MLPVIVCHVCWSTITAVNAVCPWWLFLGTTLNLLKFPIVNPAPWRLARRSERLLRDREAHVEEEMLRKRMLKTTGDLKYASLIGQYGVVDVSVIVSAEVVIK